MQSEIERRNLVIRSPAYSAPKDTISSSRVKNKKIKKNKKTQILETNLKKTRYSNYNDTSFIRLRLYLAEI